MVHLYSFVFPLEQLAQPSTGQVFLRWLHLLALKNSLERDETSQRQKVEVAFVLRFMKKRTKCSRGADASSENQHQKSHQSLLIDDPLPVDHCISV